jgi:hypothetical protein
VQQFVTPESLGPVIARIKEADPDWVMPARKRLQEGCATTLTGVLDPGLAREGQLPQVSA